MKKQSNTYPIQTLWSFVLAKGYIGVGAHWDRVSLIPLRQHWKPTSTQGRNKAQIQRCPPMPDTLTLPFDAPAARAPLIADPFDTEIATDLACYNRPCRGNLNRRHRFLGLTTGGYQSDFYCPKCRMSFGDYRSVLGERRDGDETTEGQEATK
jgi:hypothetical protein